MPSSNYPPTNRRTVNYVIDLLSIPGAYAARAGDENVVVIPMSVAEVNYTPPSPGQSERATMRVQSTAYGDIYRKRALEGQLARRGRCNDTSVPTHSLHMAHSQQFIRRCIRDPDVVDGVIAVNRANYPEIAAQDPADRRSLLHTLLLRHINVRIAQGYSGRYDPDRLSSDAIPSLRQLRPERIDQTQSHVDGFDDLSY